MGDFIKLFDSVKVSLGWDKHNIDNFVFRLHTKITVIILVTFSLVVTAQQFIGDPIDCIVTKDVPPKMMDTYCWIHSTFTLPQRILDNDDGMSVHPGVGNQGQDEEARSHKYYQWVCFTLILQALLFYVPRFIWNTWEGDKIKNLVPEELLYNVTDARMPSFPKPRGLVSDDSINSHVEEMVAFLTRFFGRRRTNLHNHYFMRFQFCEWLNFANVLIQIFFVDFFLGGMFTTYGTMVWSMSSMDPEDRTDPMSLVFPKVTKCTFYKSGPTGTIQNYDGLCVLPINIINEKIYIFMWTWFIFLAVVSAVYQVYRLLTLCSSSIRSQALQVYAHNLAGRDITHRLVALLGPGEWFLLCQLGANLDPYIFTQVLFELEKKLFNQRPLSNGGLSNNSKKVDKIA